MPTIKGCPDADPVSKKTGRKLPDVTGRINHMNKKNLKKNLSVL